MSRLVRVSDAVSIRIGQTRYKGVLKFVREVDYDKLLEKTKSKEEADELYNKKNKYVYSHLLC